MDCRLHQLCEPEAVINDHVFQAAHYLFRPDDLSFFVARRACVLHAGRMCQDLSKHLSILLLSPRIGLRDGGLDLLGLLLRQDAGEGELFGVLD
jgi:hypothetical protein